MQSQNVHVAVIKCIELQGSKINLSSPDASFNNWDQYHQTSPASRAKQLIVIVLFLIGHKPATTGKISGHHSNDIVAL